MYFDEDKYFEEILKPDEDDEEDVNKVIEGVGKDAEIVVNENGGKQSKSPMAMHLIDPRFLGKLAYLHYIKPEHKAIGYIADLMNGYTEAQLIKAIEELEPDKNKVLVRIATVLQEGAERYEPNNWRLIPQEEHINHALIHLLASAMGDTQDNHLDHALCRLMMAYATNKSKNFDYKEYIKK